MHVEIIITILLFLGIFITAIPALPGMLYMLAVLLVYVAIDGFAHFNPWFLLLFGGLALAAILSDYLAGIIGAKVGGANKVSMLIGFVSMIIGLILFPPFGFLPGLFLGVFLAELIQFQDGKRAWKSAFSSMIATVFGMGFNILLAIGFFISFVILVY